MAPRRGGWHGVAGSGGARDAIRALPSPRIHALTPTGGSLPWRPDPGTGRPPNPQRAALPRASHWIAQPGTESSWEPADAAGRSLCSRCPGRIRRWHGVIRAAGDNRPVLFQPARGRTSSGTGPGGVAATSLTRWAPPPVRCQVSDISLPGWCLRQREEDRDGAATRTPAWRHRFRRCTRRHQPIVPPADRESLPRQGADRCPWIMIWS